MSTKTHLMAMAFAAALGGGVEARTLDDIHIRDPFILPVPEEGEYYLFGSWHPPGKPSFVTYVSEDLRNWEGPTTVFEPPEGFWSDRDYWAPEVHRYQGRYYMFASFKAEGARRGTQILVADAPAGPYTPHSDGPVTPRDWECLDGTLYVDGDGRPWMVFCHEWVQVGDGEMCAIPLTTDLARADGESVLLFRASEALWVTGLGGNEKNKVTDGPFLHRTADGQLLMLWASFGNGAYKEGVARSTSGEIIGPWEHLPETIYDRDGGHGMLFRTFDGDLTLSLHSPNGGGLERCRLFRAEERDGTIVLHGGGAK